jgi:hypothetical protein
MLVVGGNIFLEKIQHDKHDKTTDTIEKKTIMNRDKIIAKLLYLTALLFFTINSALSQDTVKYSLDTLVTLVSVSYSDSSIGANYSIHHWPTNDDSLAYHKHKKIITSDPSENNYEDYYSLACSLWELGKLTESKKMFLKIVNSKKPFYTDTYHGLSDIPGDTTINRYGYGSYTFNYKNHACIYLTKIDLERKQYKPALEFLELADKKYLVEQNCGTGYNWYRGEIEGLYRLCYSGLGKNE